MTLTIAILCLNEEGNLPGAIASAAFANEVLIVDGGSTDRSVEIAVASGARVVERPFDDFSHQRNFALEEATGKWVFFLDADERIPSALAGEIARTCALHAYTTLTVPRVSIALGERLDWHPGGEDRPIRLVRGGVGRFEGAVHERFVSDAKPGHLKHALEHRTHRTISDLVGRIDRYSSLEATELVARGARVVSPRRVLWTAARTAWRYWRQGLRKHGIAGATEAMLLGVDRGLVLAKIWEQKHQDEIDAAYRS